MTVIRSLAFYIVFYGLSVPLVLATPLAVLLGDGAVKRLAHMWCGLHRLCTRWLLGIRIRIEGSGPVGQAIYAVRHESFFEAIDAPALFHLPAPFAKAELFRLPVWGYAARAYGVVPVEREGGASALRAMFAEADRMVAQGRPLVIFPEGTRVPHGQRAPLQAGFAGLYKRVGLPVIPVAVNSGPLYHRKWKRAGVLTYRFGAPIPPGLPRKEMEARVTDAINALNI